VYMIKSMTGFGVAEHKDDGCAMRVELRSVNNKFLKIDIRLPSVLQAFEGEIERAIRGKINRGTVLLHVNYQSLLRESECVLNSDRLKEYYAILSNVRNEIGSTVEISLNALINLPGVLQKREERTEDANALLSMCLSLINEAMAKMQEMRAVEGVHLGKDIGQRKEFVLSSLNKIEAAAPSIVLEYSKRLRTRVESLLVGTTVELTDNNLCREIALFAERCDITEEISRLRSHLCQLQEAIQSDEPVGRKLDFLIQEMFREANTMCSKANDNAVLKDMVEIKTEIEKIREQAFNVE
ncbi:MAG: YicC/YloC family endoribonuclease, partial [Planctomycetota bacterium]